MVGSVAAERHLWLNLTEIREKEKVFLLDAPISQSGLFREAVSSVVENFRSAKMQWAALKQFMPRRMRDHSTPSSSLSREQSLVGPRLRTLPQLRFGEPVRLSPSTVRPFAASRPRVRGHSRFSPAAYGPHVGHLSVQHFTLHESKQGRRGLSFVVEGVTASRPSRHPNSGMSSFARHSASSIAFNS